jgi:hypothetical protein
VVVGGEARRKVSIGIGPRLGEQKIGELWSRGAEQRIYSGAKGRGAEN